MFKPRCGTRGRNYQPFEYGDEGLLHLKRYSLTKADRIRRRSEYQALSIDGKRRYSHYFIVISQSNQRQRSRLGITVNKKVGKAVTRNKIKRIIRDYFRLNRNILPGRLDINIIARPPSGILGAAAIRRELRRCFGRLAEAPDQSNDE